MSNFDAFEWVDESLPGKHVYGMVLVDQMRSRLSVRHFKVEELRDDLFAGTTDTCFIMYLSCWPKLRVARISDYLLSTSVLHVCTLEQMRKFM